jgi:hypothetical protein
MFRIYDLSTNHHIAALAIRGCNGATIVQHCASAACVREDCA